MDHYSICQWDEQYCSQGRRQWGDMVGRALLKDWLRLPIHPLEKLASPPQPNFVELPVQEKRVRKKRKRLSCKIFIFENRLSRRNIPIFF